MSQFLRRLTGNRLKLVLVLILAAPVAQAADVVPTLHHTGIGSRSIDAAIQAVSQGRFDG